MSDETSSHSALERYTAIGTGVPMLVIAMSMFGWGVRLAVAGLRTEAGWPPGLHQLLLPIALTAPIIGVGGWRLLLTGLPSRIFGWSLGRMILAGFGIAALVGALI